MANGHGGARPGAGKKKKPLADKVLEGNPGKRQLQVIEFKTSTDLQGQPMPPPREMLSAVQKGLQHNFGQFVKQQILECLDSSALAIA